MCFAFRVCPRTDVANPTSISTLQHLPSMSHARNFVGGRVKEAKIQPPLSTDPASSSVSGPDLRRWQTLHQHC